jgi:hypothetical protein
MVHNALKAFVACIPDNEKPTWNNTLKMMNVLLDGAAVGINTSLLEARLASMVDRGMFN